jgi:dolichyl-phosphate beta-glucosyltransferase
MADAGQSGVTGGDAASGERARSVDLVLLEAESALTAAYDLTATTLTEYPSDVLDHEDHEVALADLTLVIPMYRESARIGATIATLAASPLHRSGIAFLFVDDGSGDDTAAVTEAAIRREGLRFATVRSLPQNVGKGGAVRAGMAIAKGRYLGYLDADLSLDPADVSRALARIEATGAHMIIGERVVEMKRQPKLRRLASGVFRKLASEISGVALVDPQCAMKLFRSDAASSLFGALTIDGFAFDVELLARAAKQNFHVEEIKIRWEHQSGSRVNPITDSIRMYTELLRIRRALR